MVTAIFRKKGKKEDLMVIARFTCGTEEGRKSLLVRWKRECVWSVEEAGTM